TGSTGHLNLWGWCDCNILLQVFIWVVLRSYGGDWREGGGFTLKEVVGMEGGGVGFSKGRGFAASFFSTTPRPPFKGALVAALLCLG
ncbi:MAG: hypothetical protein IKC17_00195, partial [Bacteroidales bacterium]|nr:hypothetical protein [Bacteroidales bacterium]